MELTNEALLKAYKGFLTRNGFNIIYDGSVPNDDTGVFFVMYFENPDNAKEPFYVFYEVFMGADLSLDGFKKYVIDEKNQEDFLKMVQARVKGCTIHKSGILCCMLENNYMIDDIYINGQPKLSPKILRMVSHWVNFKGGLTPVKRSSKGN